MLGRYQIYVRRKRPADDPLPEGRREDTRKHTRHCLRPSPEMVEGYLSHPTAEAWKRFQRDYLKLLRNRFGDDRQPFDALADRARGEDVYIGCVCPTKTNPNLAHCHTIPALAFMQQQYPDLTVVYPPGVEPPSIR